LYRSRNLKRFLSEFLVETRAEILSTANCAYIGRVRLGVRFNAFEMDGKPAALTKITVDNAGYSLLAQNANRPNQLRHSQIRILPTPVVNCYIPQFLEICRIWDHHTRKQRRNSGAQTFALMNGRGLARPLSTFHELYRVGSFGLSGGIAGFPGAGVFLISTGIVTRVPGPGVTDWEE